MKTVNQVSSRRPDSLVMLLSHQQSSGKFLCACQVPKVRNHTIRRSSLIIKLHYTRSGTLQYNVIYKYNIINPFV